MTERLPASLVELVSLPGADLPPPEEAARLRADLTKLFPDRTPRRTLRVVVGWSSRERAWKLAAANHHLAAVAWADCAQDVARRLEAAGHHVMLKSRRGS